PNATALREASRGDRREQGRGARPREQRGAGRASGSIGARSADERRCPTRPARPHASPAGSLRLNKGTPSEIDLGAEEQALRLDARVVAAVPPQVPPLLELVAERQAEILPFEPEGADAQARLEAQHGDGARPVLAGLRLDEVAGPVVGRAVEALPG